MFLANNLNKGGSLGDYQISRSLRFNSADSANLTRTPSSASNQKTWTWSGWVKRSTLGTNQTFFNAGGNGFIARFNSSTDYLEVYNYSGAYQLQVLTAQVFRDVSAWYHIVIAIDTTQATDTNRFKLYVNGSQVTSFYGAPTYPSQNTDLFVNGTGVHALGVLNGVGQYFDGYMTEVNFVNAQQLTPSSFGETNAQTGVWQPKAYSGSYGTNGFYLNFSDNSNTTDTTLGKDYSGNGNNWTPNGFLVSTGPNNDSLVDSPTSYGTDTGVGGTVRGNYCTLNPLAKGAGTTLANGNLDWVATGSNQKTLSTIGMSSGKWYCEVTVTTNTYILMGIAEMTAPLTTAPGGDATGYAYGYLGQKWNNNTGSVYSTLPLGGDIIGIAFDADAGSITFYKNGTSLGVAFSSIPASTYCFTVGTDGTAGTCNFGQRPFAYTAPSGFKALCTQNLPTPTIGATTATQASKYFNIKLYTGNGSAGNAQSGLGFQPDFLWIKSRSAARSHALFNAVMTRTFGLASESTNAEYTSIAGRDLASFDSDGFTVGVPENFGSTNTSGDSIVAWAWKANGSGSSNTAGSITSTVSANTTSGFSVVTYTGTGANATVGHGLGVAPSMVIVKNRTSTGSWCTWHTGLTSGAYALFLESTDAQGSYPTIFNSTVPTSTVFSVGTATGTNASANNLVAYCFAEVAGYSKFGSYTGNGSADGPFVYTGFRPAYVMIKSTSLSQPWVVKDKLRAANYNPQDGNLYPNLSNAEDTTASVYIDLLSNGFKIRGDYAGINSGVSSYIFMAFAEAPQKFSLAR